MNTKVKIALVTFTAITAASAALSILGSENALVERFPDLEPKLVYKAHRKMLLATVTGQYSEFDLDDEEVCDSIFLNIVRDLQNS